MTGDQIVDQILAGAFEDTVAGRAKALGWANTALGTLWNLHPDWTFRQANAAVTVTAGQMAVSSTPADLGAVLSLQRADGEPLDPITDWAEFARRYLGTGNERQGLPEAYVAVNGTITVGPTSSESSAAYRLGYERRLTLLADSEESSPAIPEEAHLAVVFGGQARGYLLSNVERANELFREERRIIESLERTYRRSMRGMPTQMAAYRPGW